MEDLADLPKVTRIPVEGHEAVVVDNALLPAQIEQCHAFAQTASFMRSTYKCRTHGDPTEYEGEQTFCPVADVARLEALGIVPLWHMAESLLRTELEICHAHLNRIAAGEDRFPHIDARHPGMWVAVVCFNDRWDPRWGGELLLYTAGVEARAAVSWVPGRMILFPATLTHRGGVPTSIAPGPRFALALKLRVPGRDQMLREHLGKV